MSMIDPRKTHQQEEEEEGEQHGTDWSLLMVGALLGSAAGVLLGCGLAGSVLNYGLIRTSDSRIDNDDLAVQLMSDDTENQV